MSYSFEQVAQLVNKLKKMGWGPERVTALGQANARKFRAIETILEGKTLEEAIRVAVSMKVDVLGNDTSHLRFLESVELAPTSGKVTLAQSSDILNVDLNFKNWGTDKTGSDTQGQTALIYEMKQDGTFANLFNSFGVDLSSLVWQQAQIREFCVSHRHLLRHDGYGTFFLFEVDKKLFVASVSVGDGELSANVDRISDGRVWGAGSRHRLVVPQQTI